MEKPPESDQGHVVKVIAVKLPFDLEERILSFPFLHALYEYYPQADIHFITPKKEIEVLNLLPFKAYYHEFDEDEIETVFDVHRFCVSAKIYNVDIFISLTNSFVDACLGLGLRAKRRIGFAENWKTLVLTDKVLRGSGHHFVEDTFALFKLTTGFDVNSRIKVIARDLVSIMPEDEDRPYVAIHLSPLRGPTIEAEWAELLTLFENQKLVLFVTDDIVKFQGLIEPFMAALPKTNQYVNFVYKNWIDLARMLAHAKGVISYSGAAAALGAYVGTRSLILYDNQDPQRTGPFYFLSDVSVVGTNNPSMINSAPQTGSIKPRSTFDMSEIFSKACEFFRL